jgi:hypothetical protein
MTKIIATISIYLPSQLKHCTNSPHFTVKDIRETGVFFFQAYGIIALTTIDIYVPILL